MRYNPIDDPGIRAGAEKPIEENKEAEEVVNTISSFSFDISNILRAIKEFFDKLVAIFKR